MENKIKEFKGFLWEEKGITLNDLYKEGAKHYFGMVRHNSGEYVTQQNIEEDLESSFDELHEQIQVIDVFEEFSENAGIEYYELTNEIKNSLKPEIMEYLLNNIDEIEESANDNGED